MINRICVRCFIPELQTKSLLAQSHWQFVWSESRQTLAIDWLCRQMFHQRWNLPYSDRNGRLKIIHTLLSMINVSILLPESTCKWCYYGKLGGTIIRQSTFLYSKGTPHRWINGWAISFEDPIHFTKSSNWFSPCRVFPVI